jgi:predicted nucleotidyltransferase
VEESDSRPGSINNVQIFGHVCDYSNMRFHDPLDDVLGNTIRVRVLRALHASRSQGLTGRELSRRAEASASQTIDALAVLERAGLVCREAQGASHVWTLARDHVLVEPLGRLFEFESSIFGRLREDLETAVKDLPVRRASLFGSIARGDEDSSSDIDLFVEVVASKELQSVQESLGTLSASFARRFGNPLSSLVLTRGQVRAATNPQLLDSIRREGIPVGT